MSKLKSKDLMIGDWVCFDGDTEYTNPVQIDGISTEEACVDGDWYDVWEPITLTTKILEKNGFLEQSEDYMRYFKSYDENYYFGFESISYYLDTKIAKVTKESKQSGVQEKVELVCTCVHQLQHALKLCGIEKEIVL